MLKSQIPVGDLCSNHRSSLEDLAMLKSQILVGESVFKSYILVGESSYVEITDPCWRSMFKS